MSNSLKSNQLRGRNSGRTLVAVSLALTLAAFGCTTDRNLGDGTPVTTPGVRSTPTGGASTGSESAPQNPPMYSSSSARFDSPLPAVRPRRLTPDEAALIMAERAPRVRVLGPAYPGEPGRPYASEGLVTGQWVNPAMQTNPQLTVNSSLTSNPTAGIATGAGDGGAGVGVGGGAITSGSVAVAGTGSVLGTTSGAGAVLGTTPAPGGATPLLGTTTTNSPAATANTGAGVTGTSVANAGSTAGTPVFNAATSGPALNGLASRTLSPTAASVVNPPATISATPGLASVASQRTALNTLTTNNSTVNTNNATATTSGTATRTAISNTTAGVSNPVRLTTTGNGRRTITNQ
jgi:hypothetical protein